MNKINLFNKNKNSINPLKNPFKKENIDSISLTYRKVMFEKYFSWRGRVSFTKGNTSGEQKFEVTDLESETPFEDITKQIQNFVDNL